MSRESFLDVLRFVAAGAVVLYHFGFRGYSADGFQVLTYPQLSPVARYGYLGVQLFFMISGYVIPMSLAGRTVREFISHRAIRLYPTFWLCMALTVLTVTSIGEPRFSANDVLANLTMAAPWFGASYVDGAYWSLVLELQFYALVAVATYFFGFKALPIALLAWLLIGGIASALSTLGATIPYLGGHYYMYFAIGAGCYFVHRGVTRYGAVLVFCGLLLAVAQTAHTAKGDSVRFAAHISPAIAVALVFVCALAVYFTPQISSRMGRASSAAVAIGGLTYPLYLLHQMIGYSLLNRFFTEETKWVGLALVVVTLLAAATAVYVFFDKPVRASLRRALTDGVHRSTSTIRPS